MLKPIKITLHTLLISSLFMLNSAFAATITLPRTGQTICYDAAGTVVACAGSGQDGGKLKGAAWPVPRFTDNSNGTVTDNLTGLIWLKNANCTDTSGGIVRSGGTLVWADALTWSNGVANGICGLTDGSTAGAWRLPNITELESLVDAERSNPALPSGHPFTSVQSSPYWSSSSYSNNTTNAWNVGMVDGSLNGGTGKTIFSLYVWPVRAGQ
jgi:hypothetical protein